MSIALTGLPFCLHLRDRITAFSFTQLTDLTAPIPSQRHFQDGTDVVVDSFLYHASDRFVNSRGHSCHVNTETEQLCHSLLSAANIRVNRVCSKSASLRSKGVNGQVFAPVFRQSKRAASVSICIAIATAVAYGGHCTGFALLHTPMNLA